MRLVLKPLFEAELTPDFAEVIKGKLLGKEVKTGEKVVVELIGEPLHFKVLLAEPSPLKVDKSTKIEFSTGDLDVINIEFGKEVDDVITFGKGFVILLGNEVVVLSKEGQKVYSEEFKSLKGIRVTEDLVVVIHGSGVKIIRP
nr:ATPase [Thermococcus sp.]